MTETPSTLTGWREVEAVGMDETLYEILPSGVFHRVSQLLKWEDEYLFDQKIFNTRANSNCHISAHYAIGMSNSLGKINTVGWSDDGRAHPTEKDISNNKRWGRDYEEDSLQINKPTLIRLGREKTAKHSALITHRDESGELWMFDQNGDAGPWSLSMAGDAVDSYRVAYYHPLESIDGADLHSFAPSRS